MVKNILDDIFSDLDSESSVIMPKSIKIKSIKSADTISDATSSFMPQKGGYSDGTSSFMPQKGGHYTSSNKKNNKDIKQLISMLSPTSESYYTANNNNTEELRDNLYNILQEGGSPDPSVPSNPGDTDDHTHIIYVCCLLDQNVVNKIKELKEQDTTEVGKRRKTRIYMNINPFNVYGSSLGGQVFGEKSYRGVKLFQDLLKDLLPNIEDHYNGNQTTYENVKKFLSTLKSKYNIIIFDAPDFLLKKYLLNETISVAEAYKLVEKSKILPEKDQKEKFKRYIDIEAKKKEEEINKKIIKKEKEIEDKIMSGLTKEQAEEEYEDIIPENGVDIPYEWFIKNVNNIVKYSQPIEKFGYDKALKEKYDDSLVNITEMAKEYKKTFIDKFDTPEKKLDLLRSLEHKRVIQSLIDKFFPVDLKAEYYKDTTPDLNKALKLLLNNPTVQDMKKEFTKDHFIHKIDTKNFEKIEKWFSTNRFGTHSPKLLFDFTGLLFICTNLTNEGILKNKDKVEQKDKRGNSLVTKILDVKKIQLDIIKKCELKKSKSNSIDKSNKFIIDLIKDIKQIHTNLTDFTMFIDFEGDDLISTILVDKIFPSEINVNVIIQKTTSLKHPALKLKSNQIKYPDEKIVLKEDPLEEFCVDNKLNSNLFTIDNIIEFLMNDFMCTYNRIKYDFIAIDYKDRIPILLALFNDDPQLLEENKNEFTFEFFKYENEPVANKKTKILQDVINGVSPNICKIAEILLQMCKSDKQKTIKLIAYLKFLQENQVCLQKKSSILSRIMSPSNRPSISSFRIQSTFPLAEVRL